METTVTPTSAKGLRLFDLLLTGVSVVAVAIVTILVVVILLPGDGGSTALPGRLDPPYDVRVDGSTFHVGPGAVRSWANFPVDLGQPTVQANPHLDVEVTVPLNRGEHRYLLVLGLAVTLAFVSVTLTKVRRLVRSARDGDPFTNLNVHRLWWAAGAAVAWPVADRLLTAAMNHTIDTEPGTTVAWPGPGLWTCAFAGVALLALAEVFRRGVELRELEQGTV